jgi:hypothetical protein
MFEVVSSNGIPKELASAMTDFADGDFGQNNLSALAEIDDALGIGQHFRCIVDGACRPADFSNFLDHFRKNLDLLITKTWVEKADEIRKENLRARIPMLLDDIEKADYRSALSELGKILQELAYLFFGKQSKKEDFTEYAFRIDPQIGLFWWYGGQLGRLAKNSDSGKEALRPVLLVGLCYLADF